MAWSVENATKAYLSTLKMGQKENEPSIAEFISALAAGKNAQSIVVTCAGPADSTILALIVAANQTNGNVICILPNNEDLIASKKFLREASDKVQFMIGKEAQELLIFNQADFVLIDCNLGNYEEIVKLVEIGCWKQNGTIIVGYNAFNCKGSWRSCGSQTQLLPIGEGLLVTRFRRNVIGSKFRSETNKNGRSWWIGKVDKFTGEEHIYRYRLPQGQVI